MLDTSRRFFPIKTLKEVLNVMALAKFNVFHWHIVDDESFPLLLSKYPNVTFNGAFKEDNIYTLDNITEIVDYAKTLAIRVVPEFDNPGHTRAIGMDPYFNEIIRCYDPNYEIGGGPPSGVLDPSYEKTYDLI